MKKIIGFLGSPHVEGNMAIMLREALKGAESKGASTKLKKLVDRFFCYLKPDCSSSRRTTRTRRREVAARGATRRVQENLEA